MKEKIIQSTIINKYGSINNFVEKKHEELSMSRNHIYLLLNYKVTNPGVLTLEKLAKLLELPLESVIADYFSNSKKEEE